ncbi:MAG: hypothetical protein ABIJ65_11325 [Chloroflexota bacterium]
MSDGFHMASADIYARLVDFKVRKMTPELEEKPSALNKKSQKY